MQKFKNQTAFFLITILLSSLTLSPLSSLASYNKTSALSYLQQHSTSAWSLLGQVALGSTSVSADGLKNISGSLATDYEVPILAITAAGQDPQTFGTIDYIAKLKTFYKDGQIGDPAILNDDIFGILALSAAKLPASDEILTAEKNFLLAEQNSDGGWSFNKGGNSDSNTTAAAITALASLNLTGSNAQISKALDYLKTCQNSDGGFTYDPKSSYGTDSDSSSTAWVLWALNSLGISHSSWGKEGHAPNTYLEDNQTIAGYFSYQNGTAEDSFSPITTAYAAIALSGKTLPLSANAAPSLPNFDFRIEGSAETVCSGQAQGPTALDIVKNAAVQCGFTYNIQQLSFGPYLNKINQDTAWGDNGWMYLVNNISPDVGASDYSLKPGDQVLWYFGKFGWPVTRITTEQTEIASGQSAKTKVEYLKNGSWLPLAQATVAAGSNDFNSDTDGNAAITATDGYYKVSAQKTDFIRSNQIMLKFGQPNSSSINLTAKLPGEVQGTSTPPTSTISFTVDANDLDFGQLSPNSPSEKQLTIKNNGTAGLNFGSVVNGDPLFVNQLSINSKTWKNFKTSIGSKNSESVSIKLLLPEGYSSTPGQKTGQLIFWATPSN